MGEKLYFQGRTQFFEDGDRVVYGEMGEVMGPVVSGPVESKGLAMHFPGNKGNANCHLSVLSRDPPVRGAPTVDGCDAPSGQWRGMD